MSDKKSNQDQQEAKANQKNNEVGDSQGGYLSRHASEENICTRETQDIGSGGPRKQTILRTTGSYKSPVDSTPSVTLLLPETSEHLDNTTSSDGDSDSQSERHKKRIQFDEMRRRHYYHMYCNPTTKTNALGETCDPNAQHVIPDQDTSDDEEDDDDYIRTGKDKQSKKQKLAK